MAPDIAAPWRSSRSTSHANDCTRTGRRHLAEIVEKLSPGEEIVLTRNNRPVARLVGEKRQPRPGPGLCKGMITIVADDDEHLKDFAEYMPSTKEIER